MWWNEPQEDRAELGRTPACQICVTEWWIALPKLKGHVVGNHLGSITILSWQYISAATMIRQGSDRKEIKMCLISGCINVGTRTGSMGAP